MDNRLFIDYPCKYKHMKQSRWADYAATVPVPHHAVVAQWADYRSPNDKLARAVAAGEWIPLRRGLYLRGKLSPNQVVLPVLANSLVGPSYVSLEYALSWYGLIPEGVVEVTSVTPRRSQQLSTPLGRFSYSHLPLPCYAVGMNLLNTSEGIGYLMASPEKALCDKLLLMRGGQVTSRLGMTQLLFEDLRIDPVRFGQLGTAVVRQLMAVGHKARLMTALLRVMERHGCQ